MMRYIIKLFNIVVQLLFVVTVLIHLITAAWIAYWAQPRKLTPAHTAIVLGAAAWGDVPSPVFLERIRYGVQLYQQGIVRQLFFTGGTPKHGFKTEAEVAQKWAIKYGVSKDDILIEQISRNTWESLQLALEKIPQSEQKNMIIVSDPYHLGRAKIMAYDLGINIQTAPTPTSQFNKAHWNIKVRFFYKECLSVWAYYLRKYRIID